MPYPGLACRSHVPAIIAILARGSCRTPSIWRSMRVRHPGMTSRTTDARSGILRARAIEEQRVEADEQPSAGAGRSVYLGKLLKAEMMRAQRRRSFRPAPARSAPLEASGGSQCARHHRHPGRCHEATTDACVRILFLASTAVRRSCAESTACQQVSADVRIGRSCLPGWRRLPPVQTLEPDAAIVGQRSLRALQRSPSPKTARIAFGEGFGCGEEESRPTM